jgi:SAM-dependent methyltransferase
MTTTQPPKPIDPSEFKTTQRAMWSAIAAGWKKWWPKFESGAQPLNDRLVALARVQPGMRVLDVATGIGEPALTAARAVGPKGSVLAVDLAPQMVALARERARDAGRANVEFREMDAEKLELEPASFDAALSRWGIMLLLDPMAALLGIRRALKPGARFASAVWSGPEHVPLIALPAMVLQRELGLPPPPPGTPGPMSLGAPGALEALLARAGFEDVKVEPMSMTMEFESPMQLREYLYDVSASLRKALDDQTEDARARVWAAIEREMRRHATPSGRIRIENRALCAGCRAGAA